ncbi:mitotic interactor and substrate of PLK1 [Eublepharis macularius]|uniref:Mitotic interactor and substrate of PLK1 n=1 Tax=Eublepharis macularius TaxID=481883 RepID=A0AA97JD21_EUBMA|nr:mitotic interactor and substrate of PLK1 [Eublepharis macularius]XP_054835224.1 mitotic interactor and substrate of PLK1 [Eublepharis macularius]XP_054835225.1 mitotic interactor and substrate of PLK1 [Eublepharis macularius]XP_054835226.1 mitotic interactor and substrate of PLK1 [Eublepharis macularius]XP_054835227.1 mitotic interactor and substrate of PLK1 [Eublepharis macularius]XP_054835229.1 mitotic interactor and substrate of PLK1 [Eublepharis macularius]
MDPDSSNVLCANPQNVDSKYEEQNGDQMVSQGEQKVEVTVEEYLDFGHCDQKTGNRQEMINFLEDGLKSKTKAINGRRELWMPSPDRESKLEVVKTGPLYDIRAYKGEKKPSRLYDEDEAEFHYTLPPESLSPEKAKELEEERREIIKSQAMKRSTRTADKWSSRDEPGATSTASPGGEKAETQRSDFMGFAVCFDKPSPDWKKTTIDPESIDTEQINFSAARQQFLTLEKSNPNLILGRKKPVTSSRRAATKNIYERDRECCPEILKGAEDPDRQRELENSKEQAALVILQRTGPAPDERVAAFQNFSGERLDWGGMPRDVRTEACDGRLPQKKFGDPLDSVAIGQDAAEGLEAREETPIEREIRLSMEREENLWRERGIPRVNSRDELVEIRSKPLLSSPLSDLASARKRKDKARVSFFIQREIEQETKREENLQKEGRLLRAYDKGSRQELGERRKVFEQEGTLPPSLAKPEPPREVQESTPGQPANDEGRRTRQDMDQSSAATLSPSVWDAGLENEPCPSRQGDSPRSKLLSTEEIADPDAQVVLRKEHFAIPMRRPKLTFPDDRGAPPARRTEGRPAWAAPREELFTLKTGKPRISLLINQEIQDALQREEELQEQRRKGRLAGSKGTEKAFCSHLRSPSSASVVAGSSSVSSSPVCAPESPTKSSTSPSPPTGRFPSESDGKTDHRLMQSPKEEEKKRRQREEGKYAGIEPTDEIDTEVVNSTKVVRHRGMRAQLWEAGQILKRGEESNPELPLFDF